MTKIRDIIKRHIRHHLEKLTGKIPKNAPMRSVHWESTEREFRAVNKLCPCGSDDDLNVHHIFPFHLYPQFELEWWNLITLCRKHHYEFGHNEDWKAFNPFVVDDMKAQALRIQKRFYRRQRILAPYIEKTKQRKTGKPA